MNNDKNKLGALPINKLVCEMSIPIMISMLIQAMYNLVDSLFIAHMAENSQAAITAMSLVFPMQSMIIAIIIGTAVGINVVLSKTFGQQRYERMNHVAGNGIFLGILTSVFFVIAGLTVIEPFLKSQTSNPVVAELGIQYMTIITTFAGVKVFNIFFERMLQATGRAKLSMISQASSAILNVILDPLFIFTFGMGIRGAAIATILAQVVGMIISFSLNVKKNKELVFAVKYLRPIKDIIIEIYKIGIPSILIQSISSVVLIYVNGILYTISETCVTAYGLYFKLNGILYMPIFGINNGVISIIGYNYGAKKPERIKETIIFALKFSWAILIIGVLAFNLIPGQIASMFNPSEELKVILVSCLRIASMGFIFFSINIILQSALQAVGKAMTSLVITILRTVVLILPAAYFLSKLDGAQNLVWYALPFSEIITSIVSIIVFKNVYNKRIKTLI